MFSRFKPLEPGTVEALNMLAEVKNKGPTIPGVGSVDDLDIGQRLSQSTPVGRHSASIPLGYISRKKAREHIGLSKSLAYFLTVTAKRQVRMRYYILNIPECGAVKTVCYSEKDIFDLKNLLLNNKRPPPTEEA